MADSGASSNAELLALQRIDEAATQLQQQGNYLGALECLERGLVLRQHFFGAESDEVWTACKSVAEMCNLLAMTYLQQQDYAVVLELLKKAEILTERDEAGRAVTLNNLACYYRRQGKLHAALTHLQKALKIEAALQKVENAADTHLNMCAVLSQLGDHPAALEHAQSALILLQEELFAQETTPLAEKADRVAVLAIAYHNIGVEQEFLKKLADAANSYRKGISISEQHLGDTHGIAITLRNSLLAVKRAQGLHRQRARPGASRAKEGARKPMRQKGAASRKTVGRSGMSGMGSTASASSSRMQGSTVPTLGADPSTVSLEQQRVAYELEQQQPRALRRGAGEGTAAAAEQLPSMELAQMISPRPAETPGPEAEEAAIPVAADAKEAGAVAFPQFPASSTCALKRVLTQELHETLLAARSSAGSDLESVIRSGMALPSDGVGVFAADADCFSNGSFGGLLRPLLSDLHGGAYVPGSTTVARRLDASKLQVPASPLDPAIASQVSFVVTRSVDGVAFAPQITAAERAQLEEKLQAAIATFADDLAGSYCPADALMKIDPQAAAGLKGDKYWAAAGCDRDWPAGRGLFTSADQQLKVELNTTEHLVLRLDQDGSDVKAAFDRVCRTIRAMEATFDFAFDTEVGYLASSLHNVGIALRCSVVMKLPLASKEAAFEDMMANYNLKAVATGDDGTITLTNRDVFGDSELKTVQNVYDGAAFFCQMEATLRTDDGSDPTDG